MSIFVNVSLVYVEPSHSKHLVRITPTPTKLSLTKFTDSSLSESFERPFCGCCCWFDSASFFLLDFLAENQVLQFKLTTSMVVPES